MTFSVSAVDIFRWPQPTFIFLLFDILFLYTKTITILKYNFWYKNHCISFSTKIFVLSNNILFKVTQSTVVDIQGWLKKIFLKLHRIFFVPFKRFRRETRRYLRSPSVRAVLLSTFIYFYWMYGKNPWFSESHSFKTR